MISKRAFAYLSIFLLSVGVSTAHGAEAAPATRKATQQELKTARRLYVSLNEKALGPAFASGSHYAFDGKGGMDVEEGYYVRPDGIAVPLIEHSRLAANEEFHAAKARFERDIRDAELAVDHYEFVELGQRILVVEEGYAVDESGFAHAVEHRGLAVATNP